MALILARSLDRLTCHTCRTAGLAVFSVAFRACLCVREAVGRQGGTVNYYSLRSLGARITWRYLARDHVRKMGPRRRPDLSRESVAAFDHGETSRDDEKALRHFQNGKTDV